MAFSSPSKTSPGKLSYLPSDVEEDPGIIDFDDPQYDFLDKDEFYLCEDIFVDDPSAYDKAYQWLKSVFEPKDHDPYFDIQQPVNTTPVNGFSRADYLSNNTVGRFNTVTRRKNENVENEAPKAPVVVPQIGPRFGTITKRTLKGFNVNSQNSSSLFSSNNNNNNNNVTNGCNGSNSTKPTTHSRIPAMPKSNPTNTASRSAIPGAIQPPTGVCNNETLVKRRLASAFPGASRLGTQARHLVANNVDDNSWQNDCF